MTPTFDLLDEPWIPCLNLAGNPTEVGLIEAFERADVLSPVRSESGLIDFSLTRVLLAILHAVAAEAGMSDEWDWEEWWQDGLPVDAIHDYLHNRRERFDLLHPDTPFMQTAHLSTPHGSTGPLAKLTVDQGGELFGTRTGCSSMAPAEAARWLIAANAYDVSGLKPGALGDTRVKGGKGYPIGPGYTGWLGGVIIEAETLEQTLLLNLVAPSMSDADWSADAPIWDEGPLTPDVSDVSVQGPASLYTWPSRRMILTHEGGNITGALICQGDKLHPSNQHLYEPMTRWRRSQAQEKAQKLPLVYMPAGHNPDKALWQGVASFMPVNVQSGKAEAQSHLPSMSAQWLARLRSKEIIGAVGPSERATPIRLRAVGVTYGTQMSVYDNFIDESLQMELALLAGGRHDVKAAVEDAPRIAAEAVGALREFAGNLIEAAHGKADRKNDASAYAITRHHAAQQAYASLEREFRAWLAHLNVRELPAQRQAWLRTTRATVRAAADLLLSDAPAAAFAGREVDGRHVSAARARTWFDAKINRLTATMEDAE